MAYQNHGEELTGLSECFSLFEGAYCVRKFTQFLTSIILLIITLITIGTYVYKYRMEKKLWLLSLLLFMSASLIANICFCLYNQTYWLYAIEAYFFNLYYLFIVSYVCLSYLLKVRRKIKEPINNGALVERKTSNDEKDNGKALFYGIFIALLTLYSAIFLFSLIREVRDTRDRDSQNNRNYCQQVEYLCFDFLCTMLSIIVLAILKKNHLEENAKFREYEKTIGSQKKGRLLSQQAGQRASSGQEQAKISKSNYPLINVWIWILTNVFCQVINLVQSGFLLKATPPQCLMIKNSPQVSNHIQLLFTFLTMYAGEIATLWYIIFVKLIKETSAIDRSKRFSEEVKIAGNIELFLPSREETLLL